MNLDSSNPPIYLPEKEQASVLRLGLENRGTQDWISPVCDLGVFHQHKKAAERLSGNSCHEEILGSEDSQREFHDYLLKHLLTNPELGYSRSGNQLIHKQEQLTWDITTEKLWQASLWVPEDFCILERKSANPGAAYLMTAASVCSPSNWILPEKIGQTIDFIHEPVPQYTEVLAERVNRFLGGIRCGRVLLRYNWSVQDGNELLWRDDLKRPVSPMSQAEESDAIGQYWRVERQTFMRLPNSGAIIFGIRIFLHSFEKLKQLEGFSNSITQLIKQLPAAEKRYKGLST